MNGYEVELPGKSKRSKVLLFFNTGASESMSSIALSEKFNMQ